MASSGFNDSNSQLNDTVDKANSKLLSSEHEEAIKVDQMATKKLSNSIDEKVSRVESSSKYWKLKARTHRECLARLRLSDRRERCMKLHIFTSGIGLFRHIFFNFFFLFLWVGKRPKSPHSDLSLSPHDCVIFHWSILALKFLLLVVKSIGSAVGYCCRCSKASRKFLCTE